MVIFLHIVVALGGMITATLALLRPRRRLLQVSYVLVGLTLASGAYLIVYDDAAILSTCLTGLVYTVIVGVTLIIAQHRLFSNP